MSDRISFKVNGVDHTVGNDVNSDVMLLDYLRNTLQLRGTKYMCREGGCGACIVNASTSPGTTSKSVNACLVSVTSCHDWDITTIEGLGNKLIGYHKLQTSLAEHHGSQCGYCSPGMIMSMHGLMEGKKDITMLEVEKAFGSNICRCTGYRPILDCFKKFAKDAPKEHKITDIENLTICKKKNKAGNKKFCGEEDDWCVVRDNDLYNEALKKITLKDGKIWYRPKTLNEVLDILTKTSIGIDYMLVAGNTAKGVIPIAEYPSILIDISHLTELKICEFDQNLIVGAGLTLTEFLDVLKVHSTQEGFSYLQKLYDHVMLVAHFLLEINILMTLQIGTIAGNLMIKHQHNSFQSDIFLLLETVGAQLTIMDILGKKTSYTMQAFLKLDMRDKIIYNVMLPPLSDTEYELVTFKLMPRAQSAHALVNCGILIKMDKSTYVVKEARIVYGALSPAFIRATATESYLVGKSLFTNETLQAAIKVLDGELVVEENPPEPSVEYRRQVAKALFYKGLLTLCPASIRGSRYQSGIVKLHDSRGLSASKQVYTTDPTLWPLNEPIEKVEGLYQCSGEAVYVEDLPSFVNEVFGAFVLSTVAVGTIIKMDPFEALKLEGVVAFYTAKDIPGLNSFTPADSVFYSTNEEILADGTVKYFNQPIAIIVAETQAVADRASKLVKVTYSNVTKPVIDIKTAKDDTARNTLYYNHEATSTDTDVYKVITGENAFYGQYHFTMETMVSVTKPTEEGLEVHSATQWPDGTHVMISRALAMDQNKIDLRIRRLGGGYGLKISRSIQGAVASSLVSCKLNRPCRFIQTLTTNMTAFGKRLPCVNTFEVAVNSSGVIQYINDNLYEDQGYLINEILIVLAIDTYFNCYDVTKFNFNAYETITDTAKNTWCRSPGTLETIAAMEYIIERISYELSLDPLAVRLANLDITNYGEMVDMVEKLKADAEYVIRKAAVDSFNTENRWKKRGLRFSFARWTPAAAQRINVIISVYHADGTITITHGGVEMGQGLNTKIAQTAAYLLNVPVSMIQIKSFDTHTAPNSFISGGSTTTQSAVIALRRACEELLARLEPIKAGLTNPTWIELIAAAFLNEIDLQSHGHASLLDIQTYSVYGLALSEVEVDCLTGEYVVTRVDLLQDVGMSFNPDIDVGQVEGGFIMAMGYWTCEKLVYNDVGRLLTDRSWDYHVPEARDLPQNFNVYLKKNTYVNDAIFSSKGVGESSACIAIGVPFAIREAITSSRQECGLPTTQWFDIDGPFSYESVFLAANACSEEYRYF